jgi:hypothetical protein
MKWSLTSMILALVFRVNPGVSMTASPIPFDEIQPDGSVVTLVLNGDENWHEQSDLNGAFNNAIYDPKSRTLF